MVEENSIELHKLSKGTGGAIDGWHGQETMWLTLSTTLRSPHWALHTWPRNSKSWNNKIKLGKECKKNIHWPPISSFAITRPYLNITIAPMLAPLIDFLKAFIMPFILLFLEWHLIGKIHIFLSAFYQIPCPFLQLSPRLKRLESYFLDSDRNKLGSRSLSGGVQCLESKKAMIFLQIYCCHQVFYHFF